jgi:hypothetical protein
MGATHFLYGLMAAGVVLFLLAVVCDLVGQGSG